MSTSVLEAFTEQQNGELASIFTKISKLLQNTKISNAELHQLQGKYFSLNKQEQHKGHPLGPLQVSK